LSLSFFFYLPATSEIHPLSLHDALPISGQELTSRACHHLTGTELIAGNGRNAQTKQPLANGSPPPGPLQEDKVEPDGKRNSSQRSEEHTSELQSRENLVCRLLLEKKKKI